MPEKLDEKNSDRELEREIKNKECYAHLQKILLF